MLKIGQSYQSIDPRKKRFYNIYIQEALGSGQIVEVFQVEVTNDEGKKGSGAAKIARHRTDEIKVEQEAEILRRIAEEFPKHYPNQDNQIPVPTGNLLLNVAIDETIENNASPVLIMPILRQRELFDVYRDKQQSATHSLDRMRAEIMAWEAAKAYLCLLDVIINQIGSDSMDRKRDTFLWDEDKNQLIVVDWNVLKDTKGNEAGAMIDALKLFGDIWFTLFTRQNATVRAQRFDDTRWGEISLIGRDFLSDLRHGSQHLLRANQRFDVRSVLKTVEKVLSFLNLNGQNLQEELARKFEQWDARPEQISLEALEQQYAEHFYIADIARRHPQAQQAQSFYEEIAEEMQAQGAAIDTQNIRISLSRLAEDRSKGLGRNSFLQLLDESLSAIQEDRNSRYKHHIEALIDEIRTIQLKDDSNNRLKAEKLQQSLFNLRSRMPNAEERLPHLLAQVNLYIKLVNAFDNLRAGSLAAALTLFCELEVLVKDSNSAEFMEQHLGFPAAEIKKFIAQLSAKTEDGAAIAPELEKNFVTKIRQEFITAARSGNHELSAFINKLSISSARLSPFENDIRLAYEQHATLLLAAYELEYAFDNASSSLLLRLVDLRISFPDLALTILASPFVESTKSYYQELKSLLGESREAHRDMYVLEQIYDLAQILIYLKPSTTYKD